MLAAQARIGLANYRTGVRALVHVLMHRPSRLLLLGYDFYSGRGAPRGFTGYYELSSGRREPPSRFGDSPHHNTTLELLFFSRLVRSHREIVVDDHMNSAMAWALGLEHAVTAKEQLIPALPPHSYHS